MISNCLSINEKGNLAISGADTTELAKQFGTPLYVYDEETIRDSCRVFISSIEKYYNGNGLPLYASKAFACKEIYRIMNEEGMGVDVVSGGELYTALKAGFPAEKIFFHGNNKTEQEIEMSMENGVGIIVVDNITELETINSIAGQKGKTVSVMLRLKPGVDAHTHDFIRTGQIDSKFGFAIETGEAYRAVIIAGDLKNINLTGIHCHIGSQIFEIEPFCLAAEVMLDFIAKVNRDLGIKLSKLNLGGGFGVKYLESDNPKDFDEFMKSVSNTVKDACKKHGIAIPTIFIEPGRSIVAPSAITLYTVGSVKSIPDIRNYVSVDGGMTDNPRYALYQSSYEIIVANKAKQPRDYIATIAGRCCESGDLIQENVAIQEPETGDIIAVFATGAYNYSMASNYNRIPRPAAVMIKNKEARVIINRESYEDLIRNDI